MLLGRQILVVECAEDDERRGGLAQGQRVEEHEAGEQDGQELAGCHDGREEQRPECLDGVEDEQLSDCCSARQHQDVPHAVRVAREERQRREQLHVQHSLRPHDRRLHSDSSGMMRT